MADVEQWLAGQAAALSTCSGAGCRTLEDMPIPSFEDASVEETEPTPP